MDSKIQAAADRLSQAMADYYKDTDHGQPESRPLSQHPVGQRVAVEGVVVQQVIPYGPAGTVVAFTFPDGEGTFAVLMPPRLAARIAPVEEF